MSRGQKNIFKRRERVFEAVKKSTKPITQTVEELADRYCVTERTIWYDLQNVTENSAPNSQKSS